MSDLIRFVIEMLQQLWPLRMILQWQRGVYYCFGRYAGTVGPGVWPVIPWLMDVLKVDVVPAIYGTPLQTVTLRDNRALTFSATVTTEVEDANLAVNAVERWQETTVELVSGLLSERLADVEPSRFDPARGKRDRLIEDLREEMDAETSKFGVRIRALRFSNFALGVRTFRFLSEMATMRTATH